MYHTILKRLLNALSGNIKIRQVHTECVTFYSTFNRDFFEILWVFGSIFQSCSQTFCWLLFFGHSILEPLCLTQKYMVYLTCSISEYIYQMNYYS